MSSAPRLGRNDPCPCGSGKRFKRCCGALAGRAQASPSGAPDPVAELQHRAAAGNAEAMAQLGLAYLTARGVPGEPARGVALVDAAAAADWAPGAALAATVRATSLWRERSWPEALDYLTRAAELGHGPSRDALRIIAAGPAAPASDEENWQLLRSAVDLDWWLRAPTAAPLREAPCIEALGGFLPPAACHWLVEQVRGRLARATIYDRRTGGALVDERRINSQSDLDVENMGLLTFLIRARIATAIGRPDEAMEIPKVLHYAPGETFAPHYDYLTPAEPAYAAELAQRGQRAETFLIYLNDDYEGGETSFTDLGLEHRGAVGDALRFSNLDPAGNPDPDTRHAGLPPTRGEKWLFSQWVRALPLS